MSADSRLLKALRALFPLVFPREPFLGPRRYRVVRMVPSASSAALTRAELQIVQKATGLPDLLIIPIWPGAAGQRSELTPGALVLVEFIDGDRGQPFVSHFSTPDDPAWRPVHLVIDASTDIKIGSSGSPPAAARVSDAVDMGKWGVTMASGFVSAVHWTAPGDVLPTVLPVDPVPPMQIDGVISSGSTKVGIG